MAKIVIIIFAILGFQIALPRPGPNQEQRIRQVQVLLKQVQSTGAETVTSIQNAQVEDAIPRRALVSQSNEFARNIHDAVYHLQQAIDQNQDGQGQQALQQVVKSLSNIVHNVQQALNNEPGQFKTQLKSEAESLVTELKKLGPVAQQPQHTELVNDEIQDVMGDLLTALHQLQVRNRLVGQNEEQIKSQIQAVTKQVSNVIQNVSYDNEITRVHLAHYAHHLAHHVGHVIHNLQREMYHHQGEVRKVLEQVINKLSEIRTSLDQAGLTEERNGVSKLKTLLKGNVHNIAVQIERLVQIAHSDIDNEREAQDLTNAIQSVLARSLVAARQLQRDVEVVIQDFQ